MLLASGFSAYSFRQGVSFWCFFVWWVGLLFVAGLLLRVLGWVFCVMLVWMRRVLVGLVVG